MTRKNSLGPPAQQEGRPGEDEAGVAKPPARRNRAAIVASGIFSSRLIGFLRERVVAHYFGVGALTDVISTAFRGPNALQVLFGEQTLSAAFIPIYSRLLEEGREEEAGRFAGAIFGLLLAAAACLSIVGVLLARPFVAVFALGYLNDAAEVARGEASVDRYELAVAAVRWIFPMTGILVLSAWALGILNSHRRFFLPYFAPVLWNAAIIAMVALAAGEWGHILPSSWDHASDPSGLVIPVCVGALFGGGLQFLVQLPLVARLVSGFRLSFSTRVEGVREALKAFGPVIAGRGVVQLSLYLDHFLAGFLVAGAPSAIRWASVLYALPISVFAMSVAAAELPELSRLQRGREEEILERVTRSLRQIAFLVIPTAVGYLAFGYLIVGAVYRTGQFAVNDQWLVYGVLAVYTLGMPASTASRLLQNLFYSLGDTKTPAKVAFGRVVVAAVVGIAAMIWFDRFPVAATLGLGPQERTLHFGAMGLALGSALGSWGEIYWLRRALRGRLEGFRLPWRGVLVMAGLALASALPAALLWKVLPALHYALAGALVVATYALTYLAAAYGLGLSEAQSWIGRLRRRRSGG
ncbi:MAG: murein biosynthesis integral membrane protein MurJ [Deltaproteobacteria bacterium]|nr:murein biosynthesis integral membrane protein MurJ [Deltaproteobacteria bacterium]